MMPRHETIFEKALEIWKNDLYKHGYDQLAENNPNEQELKEGGIWSVAISELMRDMAKSECAEWEGYNETLEKSNDLKFDINEALANGVYTCGSRNCGKSDLNMYLADRLIDQGVIVLVFDPSQDWLKRSSIQKYTTVEPHTSITIPSESTIYDLSLLTLEEQKNFVERFNRDLFNTQIQNGSQHWCFCIYEEAHQYFPQGCLNAKTFQYSVRLLTQGRNFKISMALITQFSALIDKNTMKFMNQRFFGISNEPNDLKYLRGFLNKDTDSLKEFQNGEFFYYCRNKLSRINIQPYNNVTQKTKIAIPQAQPTQLIKTSEGSNITAFLKVGLILCFIVLTLKSLGGI